MPTVLRVDGFRVSILFPPREHPPAHVHVTNADGIVVIDLDPMLARKIEGMKRADVRRAEQIVEENRELLLAKWREIWAE